MGSLTTCDPGDICTTLATCKALNIRCSVISLAAEVKHMVPCNVDQMGCNPANGRLELGFLAFKIQLHGGKCLFKSCQLAKPMYKKKIQIPGPNLSRACIDDGWRVQRLSGRLPLSRSASRAARTSAINSGNRAVAHQNGISLSRRYCCMLNRIQSLA